MNEAAQYRLVVLSAPSSYFTGAGPPPPGSGFLLDTQQPNLLDQGRDSTILIQDAAVPRLQCTIRWSEQEQVFHIWDCHARNGTFLNDVRLEPNQPVPLCPGDLIRCGRTVLKFVQG